ncbi:LuxR C-terminal-related transcriptional regulator [Nocardiopsis mangrovi]|uniref:LuxR C-terminal-related transcriptional regulator n=1 Tax=Nocardiopsis mangrovi TaxID=1179818 RepID=A0ABV9DQK4_9ACTN
MSDAPIRVVLADGQRLFRSGLGLIVDSQEDMTVVGEARDGGEALAVIDATRPDIVLMDMWMSPMNGLDAMKALSESGHDQHKDDRKGLSRASPPKVIMLTALELDRRSLEAIRYGAGGFLLKDSTPEFVIEAVRTVHAGNTVLASHDLTALLDIPAEPVRPVPPEYATLTERERRVFAAVVQGASNAEIADELCLSESTVKTHIGAILRKLGLRDRLQVVTYSYENGLGPPRRDAKRPVKGLRDRSYMQSAS